MEVRFEQLIDDPRTALADVGRFIDHNLGLDRIAANPVHALKNPNTSFREERTRGEFNPIGRWKSADAEDIRLCEALIGSYPGGARVNRRFDRRPHAAQSKRVGCAPTYLGLFEAKHLLKAHTPLGRFMTSTRVWTSSRKPERRRYGPSPRAPPPMPHTETSEEASMRG